MNNLRFQQQALASVAKPPVVMDLVFGLPGRVDAAQAARMLGFGEHDIRVLTVAKLLTPLGKPTTNSVKYFATCVIEELRKNPEWLNKATQVIGQRWQKKNGTFDKTRPRTPESVD